MEITLGDGYLSIEVEDGLTYQIEQDYSERFTVSRYEYEAVEFMTFDSLQDALEHVEEEIGRV